MPTIFLSHASTDKTFAKMLADDLSKRGHKCWLDEWEIKVGQSIPKRIQEGLAEAEFVVLILSKSSVASNWVEKEWQAKHWEQVNEGKVYVLPCLLEECVIPKLLNGHKYANFVKGYSNGLAELVDAITPIAPTSSEVLRVPQSPGSRAIAALLKRIHSPGIPLSTVLAEGIALAREIGNADLEVFCRQEIAGIEDSSAEPAEKAVSKYSWRVVQMYASTQGQLNPNYIGFRTSADLFHYMESHPEEFVPITLIWARPVADIERTHVGRTPNSTAMTLRVPRRDFNSDATKPDAMINLYGKPDLAQGLIDSIRQEFVRRLLKLLPPISTGSH